ncbi:hypothetical protein sos41_16970 [Alphaproteobacteria bacterium SO-S41]|nr:hypothetical protein sos41_16970 [Alphaproteobacteria bacterium SO-S41]
MFRPLRIGLPIIFAIVISFVVGMNAVPFDSPFFPFVIGGYIVLFPLALIFTIIGTVRAARRATLGGDPGLQTSGRKATATVIAAKPSSMTMRVGGGMPMRVLYVTLRIEDFAFGTYEYKTTRTLQMWDTGIAVGTRVPVYVDPTNKTNVFVVWAEGEQAAGAASSANVNIQSVVIDGQNADLSQVPAGLRQLLQAGLNLAQTKLQSIDPSQIPPEAAAKLKALGIQLNETHTIETTAMNVDTRTTTGHGVVHPVGADEQPVMEEGRARIEALQPNPDGTFDLDLFVTPKRRSSYRLSVTLPVPQAQIEKIKRGQYLSALLDPDSPETIEIDWEKI